MSLEDMEDQGGRPVAVKRLAQTRDKQAALTPSHAGVYPSLLAAQAEYEAVEKTAQGQRSKYAPLESVMAMVRPIFTRHGLVLSYVTYITYDGQMRVRTRKIKRSFVGKGLLWMTKCINFS